jgi:hypothetical protein
MNLDEKFWYFVGLVLSSPVNVLGLFLLLVTCVILLLAQRDKKNKIDLQYLLVDPEVKNVTLAKFAGFGAFMASTWVLVALVVENHFDATYGLGYIAGWGAVKVSQDYFNQRAKEQDHGRASN